MAPTASSPISVFARGGEAGLDFFHVHRHRAFLAWLRFKRNPVVFPKLNGEGGTMNEDTLLRLFVFNESVTFGIVEECHTTMTVRCRFASVDVA